MGRKYKEALKEEFRKGLTGASAIVEALSRAVVEAGGTKEDLSCIPHKIALQNTIAKLIVNSLVSVETGGTIMVDYNRSIEELAMRPRYDIVHGQVTSANFPTSRTDVAEVTIDFVCFGRKISPPEALPKLDKMGYRPAEARELLTFGGLPEYQNFKKKSRILSAAHLIDQPFRLVLFLDSTENFHYVGTKWFADQWEKTVRFAAVRKPKQESDSDSSHSS